MAEPLTNYNSDLLDYTVHPNTGEFSVLTYADNAYPFYHGNTSNDGAANRVVTEEGEGGLEESITNRHIRKESLEKAQ